MNNQGWPTERCETCGLRAKMNMGAAANAPLYLRLRPCARCKEVRYCNRECQRKDWPNHKKRCVIPGDQPPPPMDKDLRKAVQGQIANRGCYIMARAQQDASRQGPIRDNDVISVHTIGFHEHDAPELALPKLPHRLLQRAGGLLAYIRNERPGSKPLGEGETISVNGLTVKATHVNGKRLKDANFLGLVAVRAFYSLKKSDGLVRCIELELEDEGDLNDELKEAMAKAELGAKPSAEVAAAELRAHDRLQAQNAVDAAKEMAAMKLQKEMDGVDRDGAPVMSSTEAATIGAWHAKNAAKKPA